MIEMLMLHAKHMPHAWLQSSDWKRRQTPHSRQCRTMMANHMTHKVNLLFR
jgi:hypothetical protein